MPAATTSKTNHSKKPGAPKAKGAVRAKSGCYTCRIRRKKCDEKPNETGHCETCVRLRLQCLGFGAKRPEWLRENRNVADLRDKIKTFLAAQGMIKGHSGSGPRNAEQEPAFLRLTNDPLPYEHSSSSESPPTRSLTLSREDSYRVNISSVRDHPWSPSNDTHGYSSSGFHSSLRQPSPFSGSSTSSNHEISTAFPLSNSSHSIVPFFPAMGCSFGRSYMLSTAYLHEQSEMDYDDFQGIFLSRNPSPCVPQAVLDDFVKHYLDNVMDIQYLLGDKRMLPEMIYQMVTTHEASREAVRLLAGIHFKRFINPNNTAVDSVTHSRLQELQALLRRGPLTAADAMAALHIVSLYLFDGGRGAWNEFLSMASQYVHNILYRSQYLSPSDALRNCSSNDAFIIKTSIWFDVLASITTREKPYFLPAIREMFNPSSSGVYEPNDQCEDQYSMMSPMGCDNHVVWALAEASDLSVWKREQVKKGCLSNPDLVAKAAEIEKYLVPRALVRLPSFFADNLSYCRFLASEIFRSASHLFLRSVVSGDHPPVKDIRESVQETIYCIQQIPGDTYTEVSRSVIRSTVFPIFICGALTDRKDYREIIKLTLERESGSEGVGNCNSIYTLLEDVWATRDKGDKGAPINWREKLTDPVTKSQILLV